MFFVEKLRYNVAATSIAGTDPNVIEDYVMIPSKYHPVLPHLSEL